MIAKSEIESIAALENSCEKNHNKYRIELKKDGLFYHTQSKNILEVNGWMYFYNDYNEIKSIVESEKISSKETDDWLERLIE